MRTDLSSFACLREPASRKYYDRKRAEGKGHRSAWICLARRRINLLYVMLEERSRYRPCAGVGRPLVA